MILVPGPAREVVVVRDIYKMFVQHEVNESTIADLLNKQGEKRDATHPWTRATVHEVLTNEKYVGNNVYNRASFKLKKRRVVNPPEMRVRCNAAFEPVVTPEEFDRARGIIQERSKKFTNEGLLVQLKTLLERQRSFFGSDDSRIQGYAIQFGLPESIWRLVRAYTLVVTVQNTTYYFY